MIVHDEGPDLLVITQTDHARFAGELLSLWRTDGVADHPRRDDLLFATREHDNGWRESDAAPTLNPDTGRPHDFLTLPRGERNEIWARGPARFEDKRPYAALLITLHGLAVNRDPAPRDKAWKALLTALAKRKEHLLEATGTAEVVALDDYRFVDLTDALSLAACNRWRDPVERHGFKARYDPEIHTLYVEPFPLAGATTFQLPARRIPKRRYQGDADLGGELAAATWQEIPVRVAPRKSAEHLRGAAAELG
jgi:Protein of unknown function (DUF3891)